MTAPKVTPDAVPSATARWTDAEEKAGALLLSMTSTVTTADADLNDVSVTVKVITYCGAALKLRPGPAESRLSTPESRSMPKVPLGSLRVKTSALFCELVATRPPPGTTADAEASAVSLMLRVCAVVVGGRADGSSEMVMAVVDDESASGEVGLVVPSVVQGAVGVALAGM